MLIAEEYSRVDAKGHTWLHLVCRQGLWKQWRKGVANQWRREYPQLFDDHDLRLASRQEANHFSEWVAAIHLFESQGVHAVVAKWKQAYRGARGPGFNKYPEKVQRVRDTIGFVHYETICRNLRGQGPDLFLYDPRRLRCRFAEVKRRDQLTSNQLEDFKTIEEVLGVPVQLIRVHLARSARESGSTRLTGQIVWEDADELQCLGHGIEIHHADVPGTAVAFIEGFDWLHRPGTPPRVRVLKTIDSGMPRAAIERAVSRVLKGPVRHGMITRTLRAWLNG